MSILIIADTDFDGSGAATIITKFHEVLSGGAEETPNIEVFFPERQYLNRIFEDEDWVKDVFKRYDKIYLCDTGLNSDKGNENLGNILAPKVIYFDHHTTNYENQKDYQHNYAGFHVKEGPDCTAKIAFDVLCRRLIEVDVKKSNEFYKLEYFASLVNDIDMWYRKMPRSLELSDYVSYVGPLDAYNTFQEICYNPDENTPEITEALEKVSEEKESSLDLAKATLVEHTGYKTSFHSCIVDGWASWVAGEICPQDGLLAMFDLSNGSLSFRLGSNYVGMKWHEAEGTKPDCLDFAKPLGGGGHPQAAGVSAREVFPIFKELSRGLGEVLLEDYKMNDQDVDAQPNGERLEKTMDVVPRILFDADFAEEVRKSNGFPEGVDQKDVAILFLTGRFQWAVELLTRRTNTLDRQVDGLLRENS
ncbi:MAG: hypothetical protein GF334_09940 [Candidatus Altiarchaeales archaeon]|nr:hypothetical protein [Candidatus Altiarchaeales archaeon]